MMGTLSMYGRVAALALRRAAKAWPVALAVLLYPPILGAASYLAGSLGYLGGFLVGFVEAGCVSSYLYLLSQAVQGSRLTWNDLKRSFGALFWDVVSVLFVLWIAGTVVQLLQQAAGPQGVFIGAAYSLVVAIFFNPVPELLYLGRSRSVELLKDSATFIHHNWLEWFLPNVLFALILLAPSGILAQAELGELVAIVPALFSIQGPGLAVTLLSSTRSLAVLPALLIVAHYAMVFRGLLFKELSSGSRRQRAFLSQMR